MMMVALLAAITGAAAQAMVDGNVVMPVSQILLALLCGWAMGSALSAAPAIPASVRRSGVAFKCFVLIAASGLAYGVAPELGHLAEREPPPVAAVLAPGLDRRVGVNRRYISLE
jgi:hypothetical protein